MGSVLLRREQRQVSPEQVVRGELERSGCGGVVVDRLTGMADNPHDQSGLPAYGAPRNGRGAPGVPALVLVVTRTCGGA